MLTRLHIENIAVIEQADLDLHVGLNVLTGETGAGKSMVIDALCAVLGERIGKDLIRTGCDAAHVTALFEDLSDRVKDRLNALGYQADEDGLLIARHLSTSGKNTCTIGGRPATLAVLREVGRLLVNIHGQHDNQMLLHPETHIGYLDRLGDLSAQVAEFEEKYRAYCRIYKEIKALSQNEEEKQRRADLLRYQIAELEDAALTAGEETALLQKRTLFRGAEKAGASLKKADTALYGGEQTKGALAELEAAQKALADAGKTMPEADALAAKLQTILYELSDGGEQVREMTGQLDFDDYVRDQVEDRLDLLHRLSLKYGGTTEKMLAFSENAKAELRSIETSDETIRALKEKLDATESEMLALAEKLTASRKQTAQKLERQVVEELRFLDMPQVRFLVDIRPATVTASGADAVEFLMTANVGEPPKPLARIASGGELSRIMLALKSVMADADDIETLVFDEVDTGISGKAAAKVGQKLRQTAADGKRQILCVTHLASIAACAHNHLRISKEVRDDRTYTVVTPLNLQERAYELARIIGGDVTDASLAAAQEMLKKAQ